MDQPQRVFTGLQGKLFLLVWWLALMVVVRGHGHDVSFSFSNITQGMTCSNPMLNCQGDAHTYQREFIRLTADQSLGVSEFYSTGWVFYDELIRMKDSRTGKAASFSTAFTFRLSENGADGLAFVMFANQSYRGAPGGALGAYNANTLEGTKTFCVEYDTYMDSFDPSNNHVGLDLQSVVSETYANASDVGIVLSSGIEITSWIDYNDTKTTLEVRIGEDYFNKPIAPLFSYPLNLSSIVDELMYIGFAAATGEVAQTHDVLRWDLSVFGLSQTSWS